MQLQEAVTTAHETGTAFSDEVMKEHGVFELSKKQEMKDLLQTYADGQVEMLQRVSGQPQGDCCHVADGWWCTGCGRLGQDHTPFAEDTGGCLDGLQNTRSSVLQWLYTYGLE